MCVCCTSFMIVYDERKSFVVVIIITFIRTKFSHLYDDIMIWGAGICRRKRVKFMHGLLLLLLFGYLVGLFFEYIHAHLRRTLVVSLFFFVLFIYSPWWTLVIHFFSVINKWMTVVNKNNNKTTKTRTKQRWWPCNL